MLWDGLLFRTKLPASSTDTGYIERTASRVGKGPTTFLRSAKIREKNCND